MILSISPIKEAQKKFCSIQQMKSEKIQKTLVSCLGESRVLTPKDALYDRG